VLVIQEWWGLDWGIRIYPGTGHAFMGPHNALGTFNAKLADEIWPGVVSFLNSTLSDKRAATV
jgi:carboxymethylenebutenolidase